jgi:hypothetical protein
LDENSVAEDFEIIFHVPPLTFDTSSSESCLVSTALSGATVWIITLPRSIDVGLLGRIVLPRSGPALIPRPNYFGRTLLVGPSSQSGKSLISHSGDALRRFVLQKSHPGERIHGESLSGVGSGKVHIRDNWISGSHRS